MKQVLIRLEDANYEEIKQMAGKFGLSCSAFLRQIVRENLRKNKKIEAQPENFKKSIRALVPVLAESLGWKRNFRFPWQPQNASREETEKLSKFLLEKYDQEMKL